jgi:hypothetical protein
MMSIIGSNLTRDLFKILFSGGEYEDLGTCAIIQRAQVMSYIGFVGQFQQLQWKDLKMTSLTSWASVSSDYVRVVCYLETNKHTKKSRYLHQKGI